MSDEVPQVNPEPVDQPEVASASPSPYQRPQPVTNDRLWGLGAVAAVSAIVVGGAAFVMLGLGPHPLRGATRSARLKWEERDRQIRQAMEREDALLQKAAKSAPSDSSHDQSR
jgi:hypothetical protein